MGYSLYRNSSDPRCTFCSDNTLVSDASNDVLIDHIMFKQFSDNDTSEERIFDTVFPASTDDGEMDLPLSDHYGLIVTLQ